MREFKIPSVVFVLCCVVGVVGILFVAFRATNPPAPTGNFTPGVPPWQDPKLKGSVMGGQGANDWHPPVQNTKTQ